MFYMVYLQNTELEIPAVTLCKSTEDVAKLLLNMDKKYVVSGVEQFAAEYIDNHQDMCSTLNGLETGKETSDVN